MTISEQAVKAAANAHTPQFSNMDPEIQKYALQQMRAALTAAAPYMQRVRPGSLVNEAGIATVTPQPTAKTAAQADYEARILSGVEPSEAPGFEPYTRIVDFFDKDETAGSFLNDDGEGGFVGGIYRMAREIDRLRGAPAAREQALEEVARALDNEASNSIARSETCSDDMVDEFCDHAKYFKEASDFVRALSSPEHTDAIEERISYEILWKGKRTAELDSLAEAKKCAAIYSTDGPTQIIKMRTIRRVLSTSEGAEHE